MRKIVFLSIVSALLVTPAHAKRIVSHGGSCGEIKENASLSVNFSLNVSSFKEIEPKLLEQQQKVEQLAKAHQFNLSMSSANYNISVSPQPGSGPGGSGYDYRVSGSASYILPNGAAVMTLGEILSEQGYMLTISVNGYRQGGDCSGNLGEVD